MSDTMLHAVLCMPPELWSNSELDKIQRHSRYAQASKELREKDEEIERLRAEVANTYRRGQEDMRERARIECKSLEKEFDKMGGFMYDMKSYGARECADAILALPFKDYDGPPRTS